MLFLAPAAVGLALALGGPATAARPVVTGTLEQGRQLVGTPGSWVGNGTISYAYQWYRCDANGARCSSIHGATAAKVKLGAKDVGNTLGLTVRATDSTGTSTAYSSLAGIVGAASGAGAATTQPPISGDAILGEPVRAEAASWTTAPGSLAYAWRRCNANGRLCVPIAGATDDTYSLTADDVGHVLVAAVTGGGRTVLSLGSGLGRAAPGPVASGRPAVSGTPQQGQKLTASAGAWAGSGTITYAYQWYRCDSAGAHCSSIHGSTRSTYTQVAADAGKTIALTVNATDSTGTTSAYSSLAGSVASASSTLVATTQPTLTLTGHVLEVTQGTWSTAPASFAYAWLRCNENGRLCTAIAGATTSSYTLTAADHGAVVLARVTAAAGTATQAVLTAASQVSNP